MTLSVKVSINGRYKATMTVNGQSHEITGVGSDGPREYNVDLQHGQDNVITISGEQHVPEETDAAQPGQQQISDPDNEEDPGE